MTTRWRLALLSLVMLSCVGCDQAAKAMARDSLAGRTISLLGGAVRFEYAQNTGAFLSLGASLPSGMRSLLFVGGTGLIVLGLLVAMARGGHGTSPGGSLGLALLAGGAVGNLIDRVVYDGAVVDFVSVGLGGLRTGIFNLADVAITVGVILVALQGWRTAAAPGNAEAR
ncbi:MAG: signal peptidase II [Thermoanaerobaculia bacterium]